MIIDTVPNPCLTTTSEQEQYFPFSFTSNAFIQCNGDLLYVQPCPAGLLWNQDTKVCDLPATPPTPIAADQPVSYQITTGTEMKLTNVLPTISFADQKQTSYNSYGSEEETRRVKTIDER